MTEVKPRGAFWADISLVYAAAIWGSTFYVVKDSLQFIDPIVQVGYRFILASLVVAVYLVISKRKLFSNFREGFILGMLLWLLYAPQTLGLKFTTASNSGFITGLFIAFVPLYSYLVYKKTPTKNKIIAVCLSLVGLWLLTGGMERINIGDLLTLITAAAYGMHILYADSLVKKKLDAWTIAFQQFFVAGLLSLLVAVIFNLPFRGGQGAYGTILFLTLFPTLSAFVLQLLAQKITPPLKVALIFSLEPVFAAVFAWTLGGETFIPMNALGGLLIVVAMMLSEYNPANKVATV